MLRASPPLIHRVPVSVTSMSSSMRTPLPPGRECLNLRNAAPQPAAHPPGAGVGHQHVVFDAHADAFVLFKRRLHGRDECIGFDSLWQIIERVQTNGYPRFLVEKHSRFEPRTDT